MSDLTEAIAMYYVETTFMIKAVKKLSTLRKNTAIKRSRYVFGPDRAIRSKWFCR